MTRLKRGKLSHGRAGYWCKTRFLPQNDEHSDKSSKRESDVTLFVVWMDSANNVGDGFPQKEGLDARALIRKALQRVEKTPGDFAPQQTGKSVEMFYIFQQIICFFFPPKH